MKTLYEQFKKEIKPLSKITENNHFINTVAINLVKSCYLNAIDVMIERNQGSLFVIENVHKDTSNKYFIGMKDRIKDDINYLQEQRKLIKDYE
ncbi:MAG: hypothetical protein KAS32_00230 [Candidatus Peribacteraceae bacterium]|nr:hypothetical protein [Candidatus Peribacteraceae bacterium]